MTFAPGGGECQIVSVSERGCAEALAPSADETGSRFKIITLPLRVRTQETRSLRRDNKGTVAWGHLIGRWFSVQKMFWF
jgi:hypothetical protein